MRNKAFAYGVCLFALTLCCCSQTPELKSFPYETTIDLFGSSDGPESIHFHAAAQREYLAGPVDEIHYYGQGQSELSKPLKPTIHWEGSASLYTVSISEKRDYTDSFVVEITENQYSFSNLKIQTPYYYKVEDKTSVVKEGSFRIDDEIIRNMDIDGVTNARDLGGYLIDGKRTNQGMIYRTGRLNQNHVNPAVDKITEQGKKEMLEALKVRSEIDLRTVSDNEVGGLNEGVGVLGPSVRYFQCPMVYNNAHFDASNDPSLRRTFEILGDKDNYPVFFHCSIGTDRTGYIAWLINAYLGLDEESLWRDYLFSNFGDIGGSRSKSSIENGYVRDIKNCAGNTLQEKTRSYLLDRGVAQNHLDVLREMMGLPA